MDKEIHLKQVAATYNNVATVQKLIAEIIDTKEQSEKVNSTQVLVKDSQRKIESIV